MKLIQRLANDLAEGHEEFPDKYPSLSELLKFPPREIFRLWLKWNGIINWSDVIWEAVSGLKGEPEND